MIYLICRLGLQHLCTCAMTSCDQMSEADMMCCPLALSDSEGLSRVGPNTVARLWRDILLTGSFSATLQEQEQNTSTTAEIWSVCKQRNWYLVKNRILSVLTSCSRDSVNHEFFVTMDFRMRRETF